MNMFFFDFERKSIFNDYTTVMNQLFLCILSCFVWQLTTPLADKPCLCTCIWCMLFVYFSSWIYLHDICCSTSNRY